MNRADAILHGLTATVYITAVTVLALTHIIDGNTVQWMLGTAVPTLGVLTAGDHINYRNGKQ